MKRLLSLLLCAVLALFCATTAQAAGVSITLTASEYALHYAFDAGAQDPFVILGAGIPPPDHAAPAAHPAGSSLRAGAANRGRRPASLPPGAGQRS